MDVHIRKLRYFVVVAEELHFTRAAGRLFIAQQSLSRQIRDLEEEVGAELFFRTKRTVELTPAGSAFLSRVRTVLEHLDAGVEEARTHSAGTTGRLKLGFGMGAALELTPFIFESFSREFPHVEIEMREFALPDQTAGLADAWADVAIVRPPISQPGVEWEPLFVEPRVLTVPANHPLAELPAVSVRDILDVPLTMGRSTDEEYRRFWGLEDFRTGGAEPPFKPTTTNTEEIALIAAGVACTVNPAGVMRYLPHSGVRYIPISDVPGSAVAIAWRRDRKSALSTAFNRIAREVRHKETAIVHAIEHPF